jgi:putative transcriptional regulator
MQDDRFRHALVLLCDHDGDHAMGLTVNKPVPRLTLPKLLAQIGIDRSISAPKLPVLDGGPCQRDRGFVLHSDDWECADSTLSVAEGLRLTATREILTALTGPDGPSRAMLALGFAGWGPGQLEDEIRAGSWLVCDWSPEAVFGGAMHEQAWRQALARLGINAMHLAGLPGRA